MNQFMEKYELPDEEKRFITEKLTSNVIELDRTIQHAIQLLSEADQPYSLCPYTEAG